MATLQETTYGGGNKVDREAGIIRDVKILGRTSKNGREYETAAMQEASKLYEGSNVNVNHVDAKATGTRSVMEGVGWLVGSHYDDKRDGVYGDLHLLKSHAATPLLMEAAERRPERFGLSHHADGSVTHKGRKVIVESISKVISVDVVQNPATTNGLFEQVDDKPTEIKKGKTMKLKEYVEQIDKTNPLQPILAKLLEEDAMAPMADATMPAEAPAAGGESDDQIKAAFRQAVIAAFDDDSLDTKATLKKISDILKAYDKLQGGSAPASKESAPASDSAPTQESEQRKAHAREILEAAGIDKPSAAQVNALSALSDAKERKELLEAFRPKQTGTTPAPKAKPAGVAPLLESTGNVVSYPKDAKAFASTIRN